MARQRCQTLTFFQKLDVFVVNVTIASLMFTAIGGDALVADKLGQDGAKVLELANDPGIEVDVTSTCPDGPAKVNLHVQVAYEGHTLQNLDPKFSAAKLSND